MQPHDPRYCKCNLCMYPNFRESICGACGAALGYEHAEGICRVKNHHACWDILWVLGLHFPTKKYYSAGRTLAYSTPWIVSSQHLGDNLGSIELFGTKLPLFRKIWRCHCDLNKTKNPCSISSIGVVSGSGFSWRMHPAWAGKKIIF